MNKKLLPILFVLIVGSFFESCSKDDNPALVNPPPPPSALATVQTSNNIENLYWTSVDLFGSIYYAGSASVTVRGICWSKVPNPTINLTTKTVNGSGTGDFVANLTGLDIGTKYYYRAYATTSVGTAYGEEFDFTTTAPHIGDNYQGGQVLLYYGSGEIGYVPGEVHGIIVADIDINSTNPIKWYNSTNVVTNAISSAIGTGEQNTNLIVATQGSGNYAAKICYDLVLNGYDDWYLPSKDELISMYNYSTVYNLTNDMIAGTYWSSTEYNQTTAYYKNCYGGASDGNNNKSSIYYVRPLRSF